MERGSMPAFEARLLIEPGEDGTLYRLYGDGGNILTVTRQGGIQATAHTVWPGHTARFGDDPAFDFVLESPKGEGQVRLVWLGYAFRLYVDDALEDEDWPLGSLPFGPWREETGCGVSAVSFDAPQEAEAAADSALDRPMPFYLHPGLRTGVGDCMPFFRDDRWCLYYLLDCRGHRSKQGLGAHQWAQISSPDLIHWTAHPMAVPITEQWEGSICTGSLIQKDGLTYAFYAARMSDGSPARLTWAVSRDGVRFEKSGRYITLTDPYEPVSARDPNVFFGADGQYHMLVTTSIRDGGPYGGCLAHLVSGDLMSWRQMEPFIVPGYADQPECSDYFYWNGWYYLVFSHFATGRYRMSRQPFGPWIRPEYDLLDAREVQVPKTAPFHGRRLSAGFLARRPRSYAGHGVIHELFQRPDGALGVKRAEELWTGPARSEALPGVSVASPQGIAFSPLCPVSSPLRMRARLTPAGIGVRFGLALTLPSGKMTRMEWDAGTGLARFIRPGEDFDEGHGRELLPCPDAREGITVDLALWGDIFDLILSDGRAVTLRLDEPAHPGTLSVFVQDGSMMAGNVTADSYQP